MGRVSSDHQRPSRPSPCPGAGGWRLAPLRRKAEKRRRPRANEDTRPPRPQHAERPDHQTRAELGPQPTESEFEEITADTLVGPHFVTT